MKIGELLEAAMEWMVMIEMLQRQDLRLERSSCVRPWRLKE
jgi:hypothetical protein